MPRATKTPTESEPRDGFISPAALTTDDAAAYIGLAGQTLRQMRHEGRGPRYVRLGRTIRYRVVDLDAYLKKNLV